MSNCGARRKAFLANSIFFGLSALLANVSVAPAVFAQAPTTGLAAGYSSNSGKPIDIEADVLEVDDKKKLAVFKGNVSATQGDFNIRSSEILVTYTDTNKTAGTNKPQPVKEVAASPLPGGNGSIKQIDAKGKVLVTAKDGQTATSDWAIFEVEKQLVTLGGNVVVSRGTDTIKSDRLIIDITTGLTRVEQTSERSEADKSKRIQMIITPKAREKQEKKEKQEKQDNPEKQEKQN